MKVPIDMNLSPRWVGTIEGAGFEALHGSDVGPLDAADSAIMAFAKRADFVVLTHDHDFGAILAVTKAPSRAWCSCARPMSDRKRLPPTSSQR